MKNLALQLGIGIEKLLLEVNSYGDPIRKDCAHIVMPLSEYIDDLMRAVLRLEASAEVV